MDFNSIFTFLEMFNCRPNFGAWAPWIIAERLKKKQEIIKSFLKILLLSEVLRPLPPAPFGSSGLPFGGLGASILAPWGIILAPREHPGGPFWHLGEKHGSSRMHTRWSGTGWRKALPEWLELQLESVSFLNKGVWGDGVVIERWDFHTKRDYLLSNFLNGNRACRCVGSQIGLSLFLLAFLEGPSLDHLAPAWSKRSFSFSSRSRKRQGFSNHFKGTSCINGFQF